MKSLKNIAVLLLCIFFANVFADTLVKINLANEGDYESYIKNSEVKVHYRTKQFLIATTTEKNSDYVALMESPFTKGDNIYLSYLDKETKDTYIGELSKVTQIEFIDDDFVIFSVSDENIQNITPAVHSGLVRITDKEISLLKKDFLGYKEGTIKNNPAIQGYVDEVVVSNVEADIQHMEDYGTRNCYTTQSVDAQEWLVGKFEDLGLDVETQDFPMSNGPSSDNVIAYQYGLVNPEKYVIIGGHYDSISGWSSSNPAPGADDNASGVAGVIEVARVLSQYDFSYTLVYCAWSGEEYGLYGSEAYASEAAGLDKDIIGYVNIDMAGYLHPGDIVHTDMMAPASAQPLVNLYEDCVEQYVSDFVVEPGVMVGGDSDHTSFNNNGYMGIFPFEDGTNHSPYIHTADDTFGLSVNSSTMLEKFTQAALATVATMAEPFNGLYPPQNLAYELLNNDTQIKLTWEAPNVTKDIDSYNIYKDGEFLINVQTLEYIDDVEFGGEYTYYITAEYSGSTSGESGASNSVTVVVGEVIIAEYDFEDSVQGWEIENITTSWYWGNQGMGNNQTNYISYDSDEYGNGTHMQGMATSPVMDLSNTVGIEVVFDYYLRKGSDNTLSSMWVYYKKMPENEWIELEELPNQQSWTRYEVALPADANESEEVYVGLKFDDFDNWAWYGGFDNVTVAGFGTTDITEETLPENVTLNQNYPNPFNPETKISFTLPQEQNIKLEVYNITGSKVATLLKGALNKGNYSVKFDAANLTSGIYYYTLKGDNFSVTKKMMLLK